MVLESLLTFFYNSIDGLVSILPDINFTLPLDIIQGFINTIMGISYIFPLGDIAIIFGIYFSILNFHIVWKLVQRLWDSVPFV